MPLPTDTAPSQNLLLLMLDYDGTLTPIIPDFNQSYLSHEQLEMLRQIARRPSLQLAIVSGRSVSQLLVFLHALQGEPMVLVGLHGGEIYDLQQNRFLKEPPSEYLAGIEALTATLLNQRIQDIPGILLENKGFSLGVHYRLALPMDAEKALNTLRAGWEQLGLSLDFILRPGKKLLEVVPKGFNKGMGVEALIELAKTRFGVDPDLTYIGDDLTDFDAFRVVNAQHGQSIFVGTELHGESLSVKQILPDVSAVYRYLQKEILSV
jgi:trehalose 6-phosphate phosphatase